MYNEIIITQPTTLFARPADAWRSMLEDIQGATKTIILEQYIFSYDFIGKKFIEALKERATDGVKIKILCDMAGSIGFYLSSVPVELRKLGIEVVFFNPISIWRVYNIPSYFFRDHRKILIIDSEISHIGGMGIADYMTEWRDANVRITGLLARDLTRSFNAIWNHSSSLFASKKFSFRATKNLDIRLITNSPWPRQRRIYKRLLTSIRYAQERIYLSTPYFVPSIRLLRALQKAAKRGVDVRLMMPERADHLFIDYACESYFTLLLQAGVRILLYQPTMLHAKTAVIDDWATVGSFNLDNLSATYNHEANVESYNAEFIQSILDHFTFGELRCSELSYKKWIRRPIHRKMLEFLTWPFHAVL